MMAWELVLELVLNTSASPPCFFLLERFRALSTDKRQLRGCVTCASEKV